MTNIKSNVVTLDGYDCDPRTSNAEVVKMIGELMEEAQCGEIIGIAFSVIKFDKSVGTGHAGAASSSMVIGSLFRLMTELSQ